jgi:FkbM family methyltransferase
MGGLLQPLFFEPTRHLYRLITDERYRTLSFLESKFLGVPRFTDFRAHAFGWELVIPDSASFLSGFREIFVERIYAFESESDAPEILDLGANIGLSVLFFKQLYPKAKITALEADSKIFEYLVRNVHGNGFADVHLLNKAAWHENATLRFHHEGGDGGYVILTSEPDPVEIEAVDIRELFKGKRYDLVKIDIEGVEGFILPACREHLGEVKFIFVEYHSRIGQEQRLDRIINILSDAGFRLHLQSLMNIPTPFIKSKTASGFDLQLNIFGWKE